jgi:hypothetical protein
VPFLAVVCPLDFQAALLVVVPLLNDQAILVCDGEPCGGIGAVTFLL